MIKKTADKHTMAFSFAFAFAALALYTASMFLFAALFNVDIANPGRDIYFYKTSIISKVIFAVPAVWVLVALQMSSVMKPSAKGLRKGFALGWFFILGGALLFVNNFDFSKIGSIERDKWLLLLLIAVEVLLTGISEEFLCRGFLYNILFDRYKDTTKAVLLSSAVFGVLHLVNLIYQPVINTVVQVVYAFAFGVLLAAIYARSKNIWAAVFLHAFFNFCTSAPAALTPSGVAGGSAGLAENIPILAISIFAVCLGMFLIRKKKAADIASVV